MVQSKEIKRKWKGPRNFDVWFSVIFSCSVELFHCIIAPIVGKNDAVD